MATYMRKRLFLFMHKHAKDFKNFSTYSRFKLDRTYVSFIRERNEGFNCAYRRYCVANSSNQDLSITKTKPQISNELRGEDLKMLLENSATFQDNIPNSVDDVWITPVYPENALPRRDQSRHSIRPKIDPRETTVILFPGQGSQFVGMGKELLQYNNVKEMYDIASKILGRDLLHLCLCGPKQELDKTAYCQAAVLVTSLAAVEKLRVENPEAIEKCVATAGFSMGEYTSLVFAGALSFEDAVRLVKIRGEAMQEASEYVPSGMMTVFCHPDAKIKFACHVATKWCIEKGIEDPVCSVANFLYPQCKVLAGNMEALKFIELNAAEFGIKKLKYLSVSGAFHTKLMKPAEFVLQEALKKTIINIPLIPTYSNVDGRPYRNVDHIREQLKKQLCAPVKWEQMLHIVYERPIDSPFPTTFICGPDQSLRTILKLTNAKAWNTSHSISG